MKRATFAWLLTLMIVGLAFGQRRSERGLSVDERFERRDKNGDGKLAEDEVRGFVKEWFSEYDLDRSGFLDLSEYSKGRKVYTDALDLERQADSLQQPMEVVKEIVATGLDNPHGLAFQPKTKHLFVSESGAGRVVRIINNKIEPIITGFSVRGTGNQSKVTSGPLGLLFLDKNTLVVGTGGQGPGKDTLSVFHVPDVIEGPLKADQAIASFTLQASPEGKAAGNFSGLARIERYLYVSCEDGDGKGLIARATIRDGKIIEIKRRIAKSSEIKVPDAPMAIVTTGKGVISALVSCQADTSVANSNRITTYGGTAKAQSSVRTTLNNVTGLVHLELSGEAGTFYPCVYATGCIGDNPEASGLYGLQYDRGNVETLKATKLLDLKRTTAMKLSPDRTCVYITVLGNKENGGQGQVVEVRLHENVVNPLALIDRDREKMSSEERSEAIKDMRERVDLLRKELQKKRRLRKNKG